MKTLQNLCLLLWASLLLLVTPSWAQTSCADFKMLHENTSYEMLSYDSKDRLTGRMTYEVMDVNQSGGQVEAKIRSQTLDKKDKLVAEGDFTVGCEGGSIWVDMRSLVSPQMMDAYQGMEMSMQGDKMLYPGKLQAGQTLDDGTMTLEVKDKSSGRTMMTMVMKVTNRTVEGKESVQVPAGSYEGYKIRQQTEMENRAMGMKMPGTQFETVEYYVPGIGMVRSETYRNGKLQAYTVLSKLK